MKRALLGCLGCLLLCRPAAAAAAEPVTPATAAAWLDWLLPLPHEIEIRGKLALGEGRVRVRLRPGAGELEQRAAADLAALTGPARGRGAFEIVVGVLDAQDRVAGLALPEVAARLRHVPNAEQAYAILPLGADRLVLTSPGERGLYYGSRTLVQLLQARPQGQAAAVPLATVVDWPDLADRGLWEDVFTAAQVDTLSQYRLNLVDCDARLTVTPAGRGAVARLPGKGPERIDGQPYATWCRRRGVRFTPIVTHFDLLDRTGLYERYPELRAQGAAPDQRRVPPCANRPELVRVLADWLADLGSRPDVDEVCVWLSEEPVPCACPACRAAGQSVMEARAVARAWEQVHASCPGLRLRVLLTQGSFAANDQVIAALPPEVGVVYYHGIRTYDSSREPMVYYGLREAAAGGRRVGICPQLTASWAVVCPWSGAQFVRSRMQEYADKGISLLSAYATPDIALYAFNVAAAAEWSWNAHGRDERAFARAWATRRGLADPAAAAEWVTLLGPVSWDVYGSLVPYHFIPQWGVAARLVRQRVRPILGEDLFRYFPTAQHLDDDLAACDQALALAQRTGDPSLADETLVVQGYAHMVRAIYRIAETLWRRAEPLPRTALEQDLAELEAGRAQTNAALVSWEARHGAGIGGKRFTGTLALSDTVTAGIAATLSELGVPRP